MSRQLSARSAGISFNVPGYGYIAVQEKEKFVDEPLRNLIKETMRRFMKDYGEMERAEAASYTAPEGTCSECPPAGYPTDKTRCDACPLAGKLEK